MKQKPDADGVGELQLEVMEVLWTNESATVAEVHSALSARRPLAYTTVLSTLRGLEKRGYVRHRAEGKAHRFFPRVTRDQHTSARVDRLVSTLFQGRPEKLVSHLLGSETLDREQLERIRAILDADEEA